jgi:cellulose 1,4-beta-cellobiosidase
MFSTTSFNLCAPKSTLYRDVDAMLLNNKFTFDDNFSNLLRSQWCSVPRDHDKDSGMARFPTNLASAKYSVGYCDSQCSRYLKFVDGQVSTPVLHLTFNPLTISQCNVDGWVPSSNDKNERPGNHGSFCDEMDVLGSELCFRSRQPSLV